MHQRLNKPWNKKFLGRFASALGLFALVSSASAALKTHTIIIGGAGEPAGETTLFDLPIQTAGKYIKATGAPAMLVFDGGHAKTEKIVSEFSSNRKDVSPLEARAVIFELKRKILQGQIKPGEQIFLALMSHGSRRDADGTPATHGISIGQQDLLQSRELIPLRDAAEKAGVRLAIVDQSCFSGDALSIATSKTCVVSATGKDVVGYPGEWDAFWEQVKPGVTLEEAYLKGRRQRAYPSLPMISSPAGRLTEKYIADISLSILSYESDVQRRAETECADGCAPKAPEELAAEIIAIEEKLKFVGAASSGDLQNLRGSLGKQKAQLQELFHLTAKIKAKDKNPVKLGNGEEVQWSLFVDFDAKQYRADLVGEVSSTDPEWKKQIEAELARIPHMEEANKKLLETEEFRSYVKGHARHGELFKGLFSASVSVALSERPFYDRVYRKMETGEPNPCKEFVF